MTATGPAQDPSTPRSASASARLDDTSRRASRPPASQEATLPPPAPTVSTWPPRRPPPPLPPPPALDLTRAPPPRRRRGEHLGPRRVDVDHRRRRCPAPPAAPPAASSIGDLAAGLFGAADACPGDQTLAADSAAAAGGSLDCGQPVPEVVSPSAPCSVLRDGCEFFSPVLIGYRLRRPCVLFAAALWFVGRRNRRPPWVVRVREILDDAIG